MSNVTVKILKPEPITALFDTGATCLCILQQIFKKIADEINLTRKPFKVNTVSQATLGPIGKAPLDLNIEEQNFTHTLNSTYNEVTFNKKSAIMKENIHTKYTPFTYKYIALNKMPPK